MEGDALTSNEQNQASPNTRGASETGDISTVQFLPVSNSSIIQSKCSIAENISENETGEQSAANSRRPQNFMCLALVTILCNCPFGCAALILSIMSSKSFLEGKRKEAALRGKVSKWISIVGLAVSVVVILFIIVYLVAILPNVIDNAQDFLKN